MSEHLTLSTVRAQRLTDRAVATAKPKAEPYRLSDQAGLFLWVMPTGAKSWRTKYKRDGRERLITLGQYPAMSLAEARAARQRVRLDVQAGADPSAERSTAKQARIERAGQSVELMARQWHATMAKRWAPAYARQMLQRLEAHAFPVIGKRPIGEVTRNEVIKLLERAATKSGVQQADKVRQHLVCAFNDWMDRELIGRNPVDRLAGRTTLPRHEPQPAALAIEPARAVLAAVEACVRASAMMKLLHRLIALTGLRPTEVREAQWSEFTTDGMWRIPAERMKGRRGRQRSHTVFLSPQAQEVVKVARTLSRPDCPFVFPSGAHRHHYKPFNRSAVAQLLQANVGRRVHVAHGWRATMATILRQLHPEAKDLVQVMLAHQTKDAVARLYDRTDEMLFEPKLRPLACEWAELLLAGAPSAWSLAGLAEPGAAVIELRSAA